MHKDEVPTDTSLVRRLLAAQFPLWARLPITPVRSAGTDNALYRLGDDMVVRLPRISSAVGQVAKEHRWLPRLSTYLPLTIPDPLAMGDPGETFPWPWSVYRWIDGETATIDRLSDDPTQAAQDIAQFLVSLQGVDATVGPPPGPDNAFRGVPLRTRDAATRQAIAALQDTYPSDRLTSAWEEAVNAPVWPGPPRWIHGDLQSGNLLATDGRIRAVIDFGCMGVGDPACDLMVAWNLFSAPARDAFRSALQVDDASWTRGQGWALSFGVIALPYYRTSNPTLAAIARFAIDEVLSDRGFSG